MGSWIGRGFFGLAAILAVNPSDAQETVRVSVDSRGHEAEPWSTTPSLSADGRYVSFDSGASNLVPDDTNGFGDVFVHDRRTGWTTRVSVDSAGSQAHGNSGVSSISADGRRVVFLSTAPDLVPRDTNGKLDVFVHDLETGVTVRASVDSVGAEANDHSYWPRISADGRFVAFESPASNLVPGDTNGTTDVFVHDLQTGATVRASVDSAGRQASGPSVRPVISGDGRFVAFASSAPDLVPGDTNGAYDVFVKDLVAGTTVRASVDPSGGEGNDDSTYSAITPDGRWVAFTSAASNLVPGDTNGQDDVFLVDLRTGRTGRMSVSTSGAQADGQSGWAGISISAGGRFVAFDSWADNLVPDDTNEIDDVFVHDTSTGETTRASVDSFGEQATVFAYSLFGSDWPSLSADGSSIAFESYATNLVPCDTNQDFDVFVRERGPTPLLSFCAGDCAAAPCPCGNQGPPGRGCENSAGTGGARLDAAGIASLSADTLVLECSGESASARTFFLQGADPATPARYGDGLLCTGGALRRLYVHVAVGGASTAPVGGEPSISARSAALGDPIQPPAYRYYQTYYRDRGACGQVASFNASNGVRVRWEP